MKGSQEEETHQPHTIDQQQQQQQQQHDQATTADQKKHGTHVMGAPAAPVAHPDNQQAAAWVARDNQQTQYQPYVIYSPVEHPPTNNPLEPVIGMFHTWSIKAETVARNIWQNLKTGPSMSETAWGKVNLTAKAITKGGFDSLFRQIFGAELNEKLKKTFACYLSTTTGPVAGTLYLSNTRVAFCSDRPLFFTAPSGQEAWSYYRVVVPLGNIATVNPVVMKEEPPEKYIQVTTVDGHDFWFMGFVNYDKASHHLSTNMVLHVISDCGHHRGFSCTRWAVVVPLGNIATVNPVVMKEEPPEKYIQVTTVDGHDFWFMGFVNYDKASHHLGTSNGTQFLLELFSDVTKIPSRFVRLGPKLNESVTIETHVGFKRCIGLKRLSNDDVWFDNGWSDFAKSHSLSLGHFLMFHYKGNSCFSVVIFDVSASEIDYHIDQVYHIESDHDYDADDDYEGFSDNDLSEEVIDLDELLKKKKRPRTN
ncbi:unnamed protein product [Cochlearia groenlandica]